MCRVAARSDARHEAELADWLAMNLHVEQRAADPGGQARRLHAESKSGVHRATG
jgi:hypothetical protein